MTVESYLHQGKQIFFRWFRDERLRGTLRVLGCGAVGLVLSAAGLAGHAQPFAMALVGVMTGWRTVVMALGSSLGYLLFWGRGGQQGIIWVMLACATVLVVGKRPIFRQTPLILPALSALWVAAVGLGCQIAGFDTPALIYFLRVALAWASSQLFGALKRKRDSLALWCVQGIGVLALAGLGLGWLNFGAVAAGALGAGGAFPAAVLGGLALDLSEISPIPMTAVMAAACALRMIPGIPGFVTLFIPAGIYLAISLLTGGKSPVLAPALVFGGILSVYMPRRTEANRRRGETGLVQVRLELLAQTFSQARLLMLEGSEIPIDEEALLARTRERACGGCPNRRTCHSPEAIPRELLRRPMTENTKLPFFCKKPGRMVLEIRRTQEQFRLLKADRERRREYRAAVSQQYLFLAEYLREQSAQLARRGKQYHLRFTPEVAYAAKGKESENGDRFRHFSGPGGQYFLLLCDGMGTGLGAAEEGKSAASLLEGMLTAGFPADYALESLNSLLALRGKAGAVTVDLAQIRLDTGAAVLYKWGAAPSCLLRRGMPEKIGTAGPPPGIRGQDIRVKQERLSLRRGEILILLSDGVDGEGVRRRAVTEAAAPLGELAARLLETGAEETADDSSVAVVRLQGWGMLT